jgi:fibronectin type 3 domain-containing protein
MENVYFNMRRKISKLVATLMVCLVVLSVIPFNTLSVFAISCRKDSFNKNYTLSGNMAEDVVTIAKAQEGRTGSQFGYTEAWCDEFVADCIENAGADSSIVGHGGTVADFESVMRGKGAVEVTSPQVGDLVFFTFSHVEIVSKVVDGVPYSVGGNNGSTGSYKTNYCRAEHKVSSTGSVRLYLRPNYTSNVPPASPTVVLETLSTSSIKITWSSIANADLYRVDRRIKGGEAYETIAEIKSTTFTDTGLASATGYYYRVYAIQGNKKSEKQGGLLAYTNIEAPVVQLETIDTSSIRVYWNKIDKATSYRIDRRAYAGESYETIATVSNTEYVDKGLTPGSLYHYRVYAINENLISEKQSGISATTIINAPVLSTDSTTQNSITISWTKVEGAKSYRIDRRQKGAEAYETIDTITETQYVDTGLDINTGYYYRVYAIGENARSEKQGGYLVYTDSVPAPVVKVETLSSSEIRITWTKISVAEYYIVERRQYGTDTYIDIAKITGTEYIDSNLNSATGYYYRVYAVIGESKSEKQNGVGTYTKEDIIIGDVNIDGEFNISDAVLLQKYLLNTYTFTKEQWELADMTGDGKVNVFDLCLMKNKLINS